MTGAHCGHGLGAQAVRWIILKQTGPWTRNGSGLKAIRVYGKAALVAMAYDPRFAIALCQFLRRRRREIESP